MRYASLLASLLLGLAFAACGNDDEGRVDASGGTDTTGTETTSTSTEAAPAGAPVATVRVKETEFRLSPANPSVRTAGVVEFDVTNAGKVVHALEVEGPDGEVETEDIQPGSSATLKANLDKPGRYKWYCPVGDHEDRGMKGEITVAGGGGEEKNERGPGSAGDRGY